MKIARCVRGGVKEKGELWTGQGISRYLLWRRAERILRSTKTFRFSKACFFVTVSQYSKWSFNKLRIESHHHASKKLANKAKGLKICWWHIKLLSISRSFKLNDGMVIDLVWKKYESANDCLTIANWKFFKLLTKQTLHWLGSTGLAPLAWLYSLWPVFGRFRPNKEPKYIF